VVINENSTGNWTYINMQKIEYTVVIKKTSNTKMLEIDDQGYERVKEFKFLETV